MARTTRTAGLFMASAALLGLASPALAGDGGTFKGYTNAVVVGVAATADGVWMQLEGEGDATQIGHYTREESVLLVGPFVTGSIIFHSEDGDDLYANVSGAFTGPTTIDGTYTFDGGTGHFENATGTATFHLTTNDFVHAYVTFNGRVNK